MDNEFARVAYEAHHSLFRHYSEQIFRTRISIVTIILLSFGYVFGVLPWGVQQAGAVAVSVLAYLVSLLVVFLFSIEIRYYRRLFQVTVAGRTLEVDQGIGLYFCALDRPANWSVFLLYLAGIAGLTGIALVNIFKLSGSVAYYQLGIVAAAFPNALACLITRRFSIETKRLLSSSQKPKAGPPLSMAESAPNPTAQADGCAAA
jgi:hypothetical protein